MLIKVRGQVTRPQMHTDGMLQLVFTLQAAVALQCSFKPAKQQARGGVEQVFELWS